ncbi:hypothetical protein GNI_014330, partial [Gregarina niphandrodes]
MTWVATSLVEQALSNLQKVGPAAQFSPLLWREESPTISSKRTLTNEISSANVYPEVSELRELAADGLNNGRAPNGPSADGRLVGEGLSPEEEVVDFHELHMSLHKLIRQTETTATHVDELNQRLAEQNRTIDRLTQDNGYLIAELQALERQKSSNAVPRILLTPSVSPLSLRSHDFLLNDDFRCSHCGATASSRKALASDGPKSSGPRHCRLRSSGPGSSGPGSSGPSLRSGSSYLRMKSEQTGVLFPLHLKSRLASPVYIEDEEKLRTTDLAAASPVPSCRSPEVGTDCNGLCTVARVRMHRMPAHSSLSRSVSISASPGGSPPYRESPGRPSPGQSSRCGSSPSKSSPYISHPDEAGPRSPVWTEASVVCADTCVGACWGTRWVSCSPQLPAGSAKTRASRCLHALQPTGAASSSPRDEFFTASGSANVSSRHTVGGGPSTSALLLDPDPLVLDPMLLNRAGLNPSGASDSPRCLKTRLRSPARPSRAASAVHPGVRPPDQVCSAAAGDASIGAKLKRLRKTSSLRKFVRRVSGRRVGTQRLIIHPPLMTHQTTIQYDPTVTCSNAVPLQVAPWTARSETVPGPEPDLDPSGFVPLFPALERDAFENHGVESHGVDCDNLDEGIHDRPFRAPPPPLTRSVSGHGIAKKVRSQLRRTISLFQSTGFQSTGF